ncbi:MAG: hypothetical protein ACTSRP_26580, partial [Candidatus Helarchaeota archaeon]
LFFLIPVYFFSIFLYVDSITSHALYLSWFLAYLDRDFVVYFLMPLTLSVPWFIFLILFKDNFADSFQIMHETRSVITPRWTIFYALNSFLIVAAFIMPILANIMAIFGFFVLAWRVFIASDWAENKGQGAMICWFFIVVILLEILPVFVAVEGYAFTIGSLTRLISTKSSEFEAQQDEMDEANIPKRMIYFFQTIFLIIFLVFWCLELAFGGIYHSINLVINMFCIVLAFILIILSLIRGKSRGIRPSIISYFMVFIFSIIYIVRMILLINANNAELMFAVPSDVFIYWLTGSVAFFGAFYLLFWFLCFIKSFSEESL